MRILAVDTTSTFGSLVLIEDDAVAEAVPLYSPDGFSQVLFDAIDRALSRHGWTTGSIGCFAAAAGPGSFTGVRIGLAAAKGLAEAAGARAIGVSNLEALAACGTTAVRAVVMDARRGEVYGAVYGCGGNSIAPEAVMSFQRWIQTLPSGVTEVISPDFSPFRSSFPLPLPVVECRSVAAAVGRIAAARLSKGDIGDPAVMEANYVRRSDAELKWTDG